METPRQPQEEGRIEGPGDYVPRPPEPPTVPPPPAGPPTAGRREGLSGAAAAWVGFLGALVVLTVIFFFVVAAVQMTRSRPRGRALGRPFGKFVGIIRIQGVIRTGMGEGLLGPSGGLAEDVVRELRKAKEDPDCAAVVLRINSPGGSAAASQEISAELIKLKEKKPVIVSMGDMAASGGYYVAAGADTIIANEATITGSIGVISEFFNFEGLFQKLGIDMATIKSGQFKDLGNPARPMTDEERRMVQKQIMLVYDQFVKAVSKGRNLPVAEVRKLADGRIYVGEEALKHKLIDRLGTFQDALDDAAKRGKLGARYSTFDYSKRPLLEELFGSPMEALAQAFADEFSSRLGIPRPPEGLMQAPGL